MHSVLGGCFDGTAFMHYVHTEQRSVVQAVGERAVGVGVTYLPRGPLAD